VVRGQNYLCKGRGGGRGQGGRSKLKYNRPTEPRGGATMSKKHFAVVTPEPIEEVEKVVHIDMRAKA